ncbi:MAG: hypothetical protein ABFS16_00330 [Bacteroidota bacterium]
MSFSIKYNPLFKVNILHQFFLNKGTDDFLIMSEAEQEKLLAGYSVSDVFTIMPSAKSRIKLDGHNMVFKTYGSGFMVWVKVSESDDTVPFIPLDNSLELIFLLKLRHNIFLNYTELGFANAGKLFFFSNNRLSTEPGTFPLINQKGDNSLIDDTFVLSTAGSESVYEELTIPEMHNLFGVVKIRMKGETSALDVTGATGEIPEPYQVFEIIFENRKTVWRYYFDEDQKVKNKDDVEEENGNARILVTKDLQPLTQKGFVSIELGGVELPNPDASLVKPNSTNNKIYSEIYM